jgi:hypothetical protein
MDWGVARGGGAASWAAPRMGVGVTAWPGPLPAVGERTGRVKEEPAGSTSSWTQLSCKYGDFQAQHFRTFAKKFAKMIFVAGKVSP